MRPSGGRLGRCDALVTPTPRCTRQSSPAICNVEWRRPPAVAHAGSTPSVREEHVDNSESERACSLCTRTCRLRPHCERHVRHVSAPRHRFHATVSRHPNSHVERAPAPTPSRHTQERAGIPREHSLFIYRLVAVAARAMCYSNPLTQFAERAQPPRKTVRPSFARDPRIIAHAQSQRARRATVVS